MSIRKYRKLRGMTQKDLAKAMDVDQAAVSRWETGETKPLRKTHQRLAGILGCTVEELMAPDENEGNKEAEKWTC